MEGRSENRALTSQQIIGRAVTSAVWRYCFRTHNPATAKPAKAIANTPPHAGQSRKDCHTKG